MEAIGINLAALLTQIVSFLILFAVLYKLLYKPLLRVMDQRSARIREGMESARKAKEEAARSEKEIQSQIQAARTEGQAMIAQARTVAARFRDEELARAREEIGAERATAQVLIQQERDAAIEELRREFAGLAITAAERVVERSLDESAHRDLIEKVLQESSRIKQG